MASLSKLVFPLLMLFFGGSGALASHCGLVSGSQYWDCKAIENRNCGLSEDYQTCQAILGKSCALANDYWLCRGIVEKNCAIASDYWFCRAVVY